MYKRTKIVCTMGPACDSDETIREMIKAGMNVARFNFSHGSYDEHHGRIERVRLRKLRRQKRQDHELGDAVAGRDGAHFVRVVVQRDGALAAVIGVDHADAVGRAQPLLRGQPAAREHAAEIPRRDGEGEPRADHGRRVRRDGDALPVRRAGVEIIAGSIRAAAPRRHCDCCKSDTRISRCRLNDS